MILEKIESASVLMPWLFPAFFFALGACVGSFLNVCIYRLPAGLSVVRPRSRCACGREIAWYDNIPVFSWFALRGRARCCGRRFSFRYPLVEFLTACAFWYSYARFPMPAALAVMFFFSLMLVVSFVDMDTLELPDVLTVGGIVAGFMVSCAVPSLHVQTWPGNPFLYFSLQSLMLSVLGAVAGAGLLFIFKVLAESVLGREAMGEGDIVLLACIGAFCGWQGAVFAIFGGSVIGAVVMLPALLWMKLFRKASDGEMIPYGPWLALGAVAYMFFLKPAVDGHFSAVIRVFFS